MEPSSADHMVATLNNGDVRLDPWSATNSTVKSRVISARCIAKVAITMPASTIQA